MYWLVGKKPGDLTSIQRYSSTYPLNLTYGMIDVGASDAAYTDASYIRLKNASFSWQIPNGWKKSAHFQSCRLYLQGQNLLTITSYKGLDPETKNSTSLSPLRVWTFGFQIGF